MTRLLLFAAALAGCTPSSPSTSSFDCGGPDALCEVDGGRYLAIVPESHDGTALPTFVHFHGYGGSAVELYQKSSFTEPMRETGALAIYPDGVNGTWAHVGSPSSARDELAFFDAVLADVIARFPVDRERLIVSGFSQGGSMAWDVACYRGASIGATYVPVSGAFWEPLPADCPGGPLRLRHEHGTADTIVPMQGRPIGSSRQGDVRQGIGIVREVSGCTGEPRIVEEDGRRCEVWDACTDGGEVQLCLHDGGHRVTEGWHARALSFATGG